MQIIPYYDIDVDNLASQLNAGEVIIIPTETSYGLVADATNKQAIERIFLIKNREHNKPLPLIFGSYEQVLEYCRIPDLLSQFAREYWPGPLSIVASPIDDRLQSNLSNDFEGTVAVRVTSDNTLQDIMQVFKKPLVATSANISGAETPYSSKELIDIFSKNKNKPDLLIDKGDLPVVKPSTLIAVENNKVKVLRQGPIEIH